MATCQNCDHAIPDYEPCPYCQLARIELLERLDTRRDKATCFSVVVSWALHGRKPKWRAAWRVR